MDVLYRITLRRPDPTTPWGFRLRGGLEAGEPLTFKEVYRNSIADNCGIRQGDQMVALAGHLTKDMSNAEVQNALMEAGNTLEIIVERPGTNAQRLGGLEERSDKTQHGSFFPSNPRPNQNEAFAGGDNVASTTTPSSFPPSPLFHPPPFSSFPSSYSSSFSPILDPTRFWSLQRGHRRHSSPPPERASFLSRSVYSNSSDSGDIRAPKFRETIQFGGGLPPPPPPPLFHPPLTSAWLLSGPDRSGVQPSETQLRFSSTDFIDDLFDGSRRVRFAEPPASKVIELESVSSYAPSVDWEFPGGFRFPPGGGRDRWSVRSFVERDSAGRLVSGSPLGGIEVQRPQPQTSPGWRQNDDARTSFRESGPATFEPGDRPRGQGMQSFPSDRARPRPPSSPSSSSSRFSPVPRLAEEERAVRRASAEASDRFGPAPASQDDGSKMKTLLDPMKAGLFAVLDRSITDKIMNWNRPPDLEHSATYQLLKEMENTRDDY